MTILSQILIGLVFSLLIGWLAFHRGSLTKSGVVGAVIIGTSIFGFGGWVWGLTLIAFFITSSLLSHYRESIKEKLAEKFDKGHRRDLGQALANGGAAAVISLLHTIWPTPLLLAAFIGAMATVNADTWATELGVLSKHPPRMLTTWRRVEVGTSGAVTISGIAASIGGALVIGFTMVGLLFLETIIAVPLQYPIHLIPLFGAALLSGLFGSLFDSLLGATVQAIYYCPLCQKQTEKTLHNCGSKTRLESGWNWLNNDLVNFISSIAGAFAATLLYLLYRSAIQ